MNVNDTEHCTTCSAELGPGQIGECDSCQEQRERPVKVVVVCCGADGPVFHTCEVRVTNAQKEDGEHYALAKDNAADQGFEGDMIAFEAADPAASQLKALAEWLRS